MGLYVIHVGGTLRLHVDGLVFLRGERVDLSSEWGPARPVGGAGHRTILPLLQRGRYPSCAAAYKAPLRRGKLFESNNILPHAYFNRGPAHAVLLITTYLQEDLLPAEMTYNRAARRMSDRFVPPRLHPAEPAARRQPPALAPTVSTPRFSRPLPCRELVEAVIAASEVGQSWPTSRARPSRTRYAWPEQWDVNQQFPAASADVAATGSMRHI